MGLTAPSSDDAIYRDRGTEVGAYRPILQGDVFRDVPLPGVPETEDNLAAIVGHPCSIRRGPHLTDRVTFAQVVPYQHLGKEDWEEGHYRVMPLPGLRTEAEPTHHAILLEETGRVPGDQIRLESRIATLSDEGILLLQQRQIKNSTRYEAVDLAALDRACRPVLEEVELLEEWNETLCDGFEDDQLHQALAKEAELFDELMGTTPDGEIKTLRQMLITPHTRAACRRVIHDELLKRII